MNKYLLKIKFTSSTISLKIRYSSHYICGSQEQPLCKFETHKVGRIKRRLKSFEFCREIMKLLYTTPLVGVYGSFTGSCITQRLAAITR